MDFNNILDINSKALGLYNLSSLEIGFRVLLSLFLGLLVSIIFKKTSANESRHSQISKAIIFCPPIIATALMALGHSIATAFGLFAALSIIRFRTPVKDIREMVYIFFSVSIGICLGIGAIKISLISVSIICIFLILESIYNSKKSTVGIYNLRLYLKAEFFKDYKKKIDELLLKSTKNYKLVEVRTSSAEVVEVVYTLTPSSLEDIPQLINDLQGPEEVVDVNFQAPLFD
mgnify:CR=1 FL=1